MVFFSQSTWWGEPKVIKFFTGNGHLWTRPLRLICVGSLQTTSYLEELWFRLALFFPINKPPHLRDHLIRSPPWLIPTAEYPSAIKGSAISWSHTSCTWFEGWAIKCWCPLWLLVFTHVSSLIVHRPRPGHTWSTQRMKTVLALSISGSGPTATLWMWTSGMVSLFV